MFNWLRRRNAAKFEYTMHQHLPYEWRCVRCGETVHETRLVQHAEQVHGFRSRTVEIRPHRIISYENN